jgi:hypothetical protein
MSAPPRLVALAPLLIAAVWAALSLFTAAGNPDLWMHLRVGAHVVAEGFFDTDLWSATARGRPFIAHEWLSGVVFHGLYLLDDGAVSLTLLRVLLGLATLLAGLLALDADSRARTAPRLLIVAALFVVFARAEVRPHLFSLALFAALTACLERWRLSGDRRLLWPWPLLGALWANLHGGFVIGPALVAMVSVGLLVEGRLRPPPSEDAGGRARPRDGLLLAVAMAAAALVNPYGARLYAFAFELTGGDAFLKSVISEWLPTLSSAHAGNWDVPVALMLVVLALVALLGRGRRASLVDGLLLAAFLWLGLVAVRFLPYLAIVAAPIAARHMVALSEERDLSLLGRARPLVEGVIFAAMLALVAGRGVAFSARTPVPLGAGLRTPAVAPAVKLLVDAGVKGGVFHRYEHGGWLLFAGHPSLSPVIDPRIDIYGDELVRRYAGALQNPEALLAFARDHWLTAVILEDDRDGAALVRHLVSVRAFAPVRAPAGWLVLVRPDALPKG